MEADDRLLPRFGALAMDPEPHRDEDSRGLKVPREERQETQAHFVGPVKIS
jgi:hypothetical protein